MKQVFFVIVILLICSNGYPQVGTSEETGKISHIEEFYAFFRASQGNTIELVGWSNTGLVAYLDHEFNIHSWDLTIDLVIFDAIRDAIVDRVGFGYGYSLSFDGENGPVFWGRGNKAVLSYEKIAAETLRNWNETLQRYGIRERVRTFNTTLNSTPFPAFPLIHGGKTFDSWFEIIEEEEDNGLINYTWSLIGSNGTQTKIISSDKKIRDTHGYVGSTVLGYFKSPYENRLVVIAAHHDVSLGDDSHRIMLYGFHLDIGFN